MEYLNSNIDYSLNLMWINKSKNNQEYLYPAISETDLMTKFVSPIIEWAKATKKEGKINLWYDGMFTNSSSVEKTKAIFEREIKNQPDAATIEFRNIRDLPEVSQYPEVFSSATPIYFRVDLLRALAAYHTLVNKENQHFVYGDLDMKPLSKEELFDAKTQKKLEQFGIVMARGGIGDTLQPFENGFQIIGRNKPNLLLALKVAIIEINIKRALNILEGGAWDYRQPTDTQPLEQSVYDSYKSMFYYYYQLEGWGKGEYEGRNIINKLGIRFINHEPIRKVILSTTSKPCLIT